MQLTAGETNFMKKAIHTLLCRQPRLYGRILRALGSTNTEKKTLLRLVRDGDTVLDIGANVGDITLLLSHIVGRHGVTHAFEPVPPTFSQLSQRIAGECPFRNVILNNFALGDTPGVFPIHVPAGDFGQASLRTHDVASWSKAGRDSFDCEVRTLDAYVAEKKVESLRLLKIDVEGAELPALRGGQRTLDQFHPIIHFEYFAPWAKAFGYDAHDVVHFLQQHGYGHFYAGALSPLSSPAEDLEKAVDSQNVICSPTPLQPD
jgi:FkbM family methyltransferase